MLEEPSELDRRRLELAEARDRALAALKELELDHRTGKVSDEDYRTLVGPLRREAAEALRALEGPPRVKAAPPGSERAMEPTPIPEPYPPPGEVDPPTPAIGPEHGPAVIPEPYPPPDEGDPPAPAEIPEPGPQ